MCPQDANNFSCVVTDTGMMYGKFLSHHSHHFTSFFTVVQTMQDANNFSCVVVTDTGKMYGKFLGLVTPKEVDFEADHMKPLSDVMTK